MTVSGVRGEVVPPDGAFRHEALLYRDSAQFVAGTSSFIRDSLTAGEPVMVAVIAPREALLRAELGSDADLVHFIDMENVGRNPARIIPAWQEWVDRHAASGRAFRGIGEPIWAGRSAAEIVECHHHEALLNTAFDPGPGWWLLCPYDTAGLDRSVIERARCTHPRVSGGEEGFRSLGRPQPGRPAEAAATEAMFAEPLSEPGAIGYETGFALHDLPRVRREVAHQAAAAGLGAGKADDLVLAINELACNSIVHGGGAGVLRLWQDAGVLVGEVRDRGLIRNPLVGRVRPPNAGRGGGGVWMANHLCDLVQIRSTPAAGTVVRVHMALPVT